jgi:PAS domain S-box-containing protein
MGAGQPVTRSDQGPTEPERDGLGEAKFRAVFDAAPDGVLIVDNRGRIRDVNPRLEAMFGYTRAELIGQPVDMLVPDTAKPVHEGHRERYAGRPYARSMGEGLDLQGQRYDGTLFPVEISLSPMHTEDGEFVISTVRDVTARRRLRDFSVSTLRAAEDERLRLAQELHDDTAQQLSAMLLQLKVARTSTERDELAQRLDELREAIQACADGVRRIARGLRPPALQDVGIVAAIQAHVRRLTETLDLDVGIEADRLDGALGADSSLVLYRVVQEALSNVVRHSGARAATVTVRREDSTVVAVVQDDGVGFDPEQANADHGLGLIGINERVSSVGGRVEVESEPGRGTRLTFLIPIAPEPRTNG